MSLQSLHQIHDARPGNFKARAEVADRVMIVNYSGDNHASVFYDELHDLSIDPEINRVRLAFNYSEICDDLAVEYEIEAEQIVWKDITEEN